MSGGGFCPLPSPKLHLRPLREHISHLLESREGKTREKDILDEFKNYHAASDLPVKSAALPAGCSGFQGALVVRRGRVPQSQVVQLAADVARRSGGAGSRGVVCQPQSVFAARVGWAQLVHALLPPLLADLPCSAPGHVPSGPEKGTCACSTEPAPAAWVRASPSVPLERWPGALVPRGLLPCRQLQRVSMG